MARLLGQAISENAVRANGSRLWGIIGGMQSKRLTAMSARDTNEHQLIYSLRIKELASHVFGQRITPIGSYTVNQWVLFLFGVFSLQVRTYSTKEIFCTFNQLLRVLNGANVEILIIATVTN